MPRTKKEIIKDIKKHIPLVDKNCYSHNVIGLWLSELENDYGLEEVEKLINTTKLKSLGWELIE